LKSAKEKFLCGFFVVLLFAGLARFVFLPRFGRGIFNCSDKSGAILFDRFSGAP